MNNNMQGISKLGDYITNLQSTFVNSVYTFDNENEMILQIDGKLYKAKMEYLKDADKAKRIDGIEYLLE